MEMHVRGGFWPRDRLDEARTLQPPQPYVYTVLQIAVSRTVAVRVSLHSLHENFCQFSRCVCTVAMGERIYDSAFRSA